VHGRFGSPPGHRGGSRLRRRRSPRGVLERGAQLPDLARCRPVHDPAAVDDGDPRPQLILQQVPEPKAGKNRMHMDLHVPDVEAAIARFEALGARKIQESPNCIGDYCWYLLADPEGNEFCVAPG
jgi:hypothetical protein